MPVLPQRWIVEAFGGVGPRICLVLGPSGDEVVVWLCPGASCVRVDACFPVGWCHPGYVEVLGLEEAVGEEWGLNLVEFRTRCPWTNTVCVGVMSSSLACFSALALAKPQQSLVPCANGNV